MFKSTLQDAFRSQSVWKLTSLLPVEDSIAKEQSLLHLLSVGHDQRIPMAKLVRHHAEEYRALHRRRLRQFADRLSEINQLPDAIEQTPGIVSERAALAIRFGSQLGTLDQVFEQLLTVDARSFNTRRLLLRRTAIYTLLTAIVFLLSAFFINIFIFPVLRNLFEDFGLRDSFAMRWEVALWETVIDWFPLILLLAMVAAFASWSTSSRRFLRRTFSSLARRPKAWYTAQILQLLALSVKAGRPIESAVSSLARYHFDAKTRAALLLARNEMEQGEDPWQSLSRAQLISPHEAVALENSLSPATRIWTLNQLARQRHSSVTYRHENSAALLQPAVTMAFAAIALLCSAAMIGTLAELIAALS